MSGPILSNKMSTLSTKSMEKVCNIFECEICDYSTSYKHNFDKHLTTPKHQKNTFCQQTATLSTKSMEKVWKSMENKFECKVCNKFYKDRSGLWRHNKKCYPIIQETLSNKELMAKLIEQNMSLIMQNQEFKDLIKEQNQTIIQLAEKSGGNITNSNINSNNSFNINVFLNETCKNALNISEFVETLNIDIDDLEATAQLGYAGGVSKIFIKGLNNTDVHNRPVHCSDLKREILYIKDNNVWIKETTDKSILIKAIKTITHRSLKQIIEWQKLHPEYSDPDSKQSDTYQQILFNVISGSTKEETENNYNKIVKSIAKNTVIEK
jgi:hypothetical protein